MMARGIVTAIAAVLILISADVYAQQVTTKVLTLEEAKTMADAAEERARQDNWNVVITIVDAGGHAILLRRMDGTQIGSIEVAQRKAQAAVYYKRPTKAFQDEVSGGNYIMMELPGAIPFEGGLPVMDDGRVIGSIGVSGVTAVQDGIIAQAGLDAL
ncbi:MAG: heme-binding protein [Balneolales bacterium]